MAAKRHERTSARRAALQVLYTSEITDESPAAIAEGDRRLEEDGPLPEYALMLVRGVESHRIAIDNHLAATSENWSLARMPIVDRSILRLATFEMMYIDDVPTSVTINEAVELAKDFGGEDESHRFVNGILGRIAKMLEGRGPGGRCPFFLRCGCRWQRRASGDAGERNRGTRKRAPRGSEVRVAGAGGRVAGRSLLLWRLSRMIASRR